MIDRSRSEEEYKKIENLIFDMQPFVDALTKEEAKQIDQALRISVARNIDAPRVHLLNAGLALTANNVGVSEQAEKFLNFLEQRDFLPWDVIAKALMARYALEDE